MKKSIITTFLFIYCISSLSAAAMKKMDAFFFDSTEPFKVELRKVHNAQCISVKAQKILGNLRLKGIECGEYQKYEIKSSSQNVKYAIENPNAQKTANIPTKYLESLLVQNKDNLYFRPYGFGLYFASVGELFIGDESVNDILMKNGYCHPIE